MLTSEFFSHRNEKGDHAVPFIQPYAVKRLFVVRVFTALVFSQISNAF